MAAQLSVYEVVPSIIKFCGFVTINTPSITISGPTLCPLLNIPSGADHIVFCVVSPIAGLIHCTQSVVASVTFNRSCMLFSVRLASKSHVAVSVIIASKSHVAVSYIILLYPDDDRMYVTSHLGCNLISEFLLLHRSSCDGGGEEEGGEGGRSNRLPV